MLFVRFVFKNIIRVIRVIRVQNIIRVIRVQNIIRVIRVQKILFFVFKIIFFVFPQKHSSCSKLHLLLRSLALVRNAVERGNDIGISCLAVVVGQLVEGL